MSQLPSLPRRPLGPWARPLAGALVAAGLTVALVPPVHADDDERVRSGGCSRAADWRIKVDRESRGLEVEAEIDSNRPRQTWRWALRRNGNLVARGRSVTNARSGSFEVERHTGNRAGPDYFRFRATNPRTGEVCVARIGY
ncbi:MAG TPA: hypothetical protein VGE38_05155 [Nocardioides sp.]|uniref:hypothetical protein n=1 Tax=Nocardioides sp. TaxID=35761 RepID=UPI002ED7E3CA